MPFLWAQAKTFYELNGKRTDEWNWFPCNADVYSADYKEEIKEVLKDSNPDVFAISLYVWNYSLAHEIAAWVKERWPNCLVISGGPHQYFKHNINWFKEHPHLDASLPGDCYGELCFTQILDLYEDTDYVDWTQVSDIHYPSRNRNIVMSSSKKMSTADKKRYPFDWSAYAAQQDELQQFIKYQQEHFPDSLVLGVLETTRGCPYGCTYCDWGGGTNAKVLQKSPHVVKQDVDAMMTFDLTYLYIADANFGIFGERDVDIIRYIAQRKKETRQLFGVGYGGYAKTENKLKYIKEILAIDIANDLSTTKELKISLQSLDPDVLKNIDRKNIPLDKQLEVYQSLVKNKKHPLFVELIMGLPGMTIDKYYKELDVLGDYNLSLQWYEWILLPETPAYAQSYRQQYGIQTIIKNKGWGQEEDGSWREVVVGSNSLSTDDYMQVLLSNGLYHLFVMGGFYKEVIDWIRLEHDIGHGEIIKEIYENFFMRDRYCNYLKKEAQHEWNNILTDSDVPCKMTVNGESVYAIYYFVALTYNNPEFVIRLMQHLQYWFNVPHDLIIKERELHINKDTVETIKWDKGSRIAYTNKSKFQNNDVHAMVSLFQLFSGCGSIVRADKKFFGLF